MTKRNRIAAVLETALESLTVVALAALGVGGIVAVTALTIAAQVAIVAAVPAILALLTQWAWNTSVAVVFGLQTITFWQALGFCVLVIIAGWVVRVIFRGGGKSES